MATTLAPPPLQTPIIELPQTRVGDPLHRLTGLITRPWNQYFQTFANRIDVAARVVKGITIPPSSAAIAPTPIPIGATNEALYRLNWYLTIVTAASGGSEIGMYVQHTFRGTTKTQRPPTTLTTNLITDAMSGVFICASDAASPITYAIEYTSSGITNLVYAAGIVLEQID